MAGRWRHWCWVLCLALFLGGCTRGAASTPSAIVADPTSTQPTIAPTQPSTLPTLPPTPAVQGTATPTVARATATVAAVPTWPTPERNGNVAILTGHTSPVSVVAWSPDGSRFVTSSGTGTSLDYSVRLWRADGTLIATWKQPDIVRALAWSPDGRMLASGSAEATLRLSDQDGNPIRTLNVGNDPLLSLAWSPDGQLLAVGAFLSQRSRLPGSNTIPGVVRLVRPDGQVVATLRTEQTGGKFLHLAWSPDSATIAAGAIDFYVWRADGTLVATLLKGTTPSPAMARSPDGNLIAIGDENGLISLYDASGKALATIGALGSGAVRGLVFSPAGSTLAAISDAGVRLIDLARPTDEPRAIYRAEQSQWTRSFSNLAWSPDGGRLVAATPDGTLRVWSTDGTQVALLEGCPGFIAQVELSPDGKTVAAGVQDGSVCVWR